jgi:hypothetical protein
LISIEYSLPAVNDPLEFKTVVAIIDAAPEPVE